MENLGARWLLAKKVNFVPWAKVKISHNIQSQNYGTVLHGHKFAPWFVLFLGSLVCHSLESTTMHQYPKSLISGSSLEVSPICLLRAIILWQFSWQGVLQTWINWTTSWESWVHLHKKICSVLWMKRWLE